MPKPVTKLVSIKPALLPGSTGPAAKPESCRNCRLFTTTTGIVLDSIRPEHKIALIFLSPTSDEINARTPLAGGMGWFIQRVVAAAGIPSGSFGVSYLFRCFADRKHRDNYGKLKISTITDGFQGCRAHDWSSKYASEIHTTGIRDWSPDVYIPTYEAQKGLVEPAFALLVREDLEKAQRLVVAGRRPAVVFGSPAAKLLMPWMEQAGMKMWRGSAESFTWEPSVDRKNVEPMKTFKPSKAVTWRRR
jgi:hypothetical protein